MEYEKGKTKVRPYVGKMRKIIHQAAQARSLMEEELVDFSFGSYATEADAEDAEDQGLAAKPIKCANVGRCAMGELLFRIGYSNDELRDFSVDGEWGQEVYQNLWDAYRIDGKDVSTIIGGNDSVNGCSLESFAKREESLQKALTRIDKAKKRVNPYLTRLDEQGNVVGPLPTKEEIKVLQKFDVYDTYEENAENATY